MWERLDPAWHACLELAWEAYCDDCYPIGAVVTDGSGKILTRGRNRIYENRTRHGRERGSELAHAEVEALRALDFPAIDPHICSLYTTTEPCPMCMGTFYMSGLRSLHFASRDPYAGSVDLLGKTRYLSKKPIKIFGPADPALEIVIMAMAVEQECSHDGGRLIWDAVHQRWEEVIPQGVELGRSLGRSGELRAMRKKGIPPAEVINWLRSLVK